MSIRWITELLGTASAVDVYRLTGVDLVDVRDLVDKDGNNPDSVREKISAGVQSLRSGSKTVVCCDYGISRSNAIAAGIIAVHDQISFLDAVRMVQEKTGETEIKLAPLEAVRRAIEGNASSSQLKERRAILVTGARGFIGTALCKKLEDQFDVIAPSRDQLDIEMGSTQLNLLATQHHVDCIIHLANPRIYTSNIALGKTLTMLRNVLEVCAANNISLIYPSSWEIYSGYAGNLLADETVPAFAQGSYGDTKYFAELLIQQFQNISGLRCAVIRSSPIYGMGSDKPKFIYNFIDKAYQSELIFTHLYLNSDAKLDLLHIDDFVDAIIRVCVQKYMGVINVGTGITTSTRIIAEMLKNELGSKSTVKQKQIEAYTACIAMNYQKANRILGWEPKISLQEGLKQLLLDYHKNNERKAITGNIYLG